MPKDRGGHGATMAGVSIKHMVFRAIYAAFNATMQMGAIRMGEVTHLSDEEVFNDMTTNDKIVDRPGALWKRKPSARSDLAVLNKVV